jgi:Pyruvate kinase, barrel domain
MNLPGVVVDLPTLTDKDIQDLQGFAVTNQVDFIAASFVRKPEDLDNVRKVLGDEGSSIQIISKIENQEGIQNFEDILEKSDGIMVRRCTHASELPRLWLHQSIEVLGSAHALMLPITLPLASRTILLASNRPVSPHGL